MNLLTYLFSRSKAPSKLTHPAKKLIGCNCMICLSYTFKLLLTSNHRTTIVLPIQDIQVSNNHRRRGGDVTLPTSLSRWPSTTNLSLKLNSSKGKSLKMFLLVATFTILFLGVVSGQNPCEPGKLRQLIFLTWPNIITVNQSRCSIVK